MKIPRLLVAAIAGALCVPAFCHAYSTTTLKQLYTDRCVCTSDARILGFGVYCDEWNCTGSTTEIAIVNDFATSGYATLTNPYINASTSVSVGTNVNYVYGIAIVIFFLTAIAIFTLLR